MKQFLFSGLFGKMVLLPPGRAFCWLFAVQLKLLPVHVQCCAHCVEVRLRLNMSAIIISNCRIPRAACFSRKLIADGRRHDLWFVNQRSPVIQVAGSLDCNRTYMKSMKKLPYLRVHFQTLSGTVCMWCFWGTFATISPVHVTTCRGRMSSYKVTTCHWRTKTYNTITILCACLRV